MEFFFYWIPDQVGNDGKSEDKLIMALFIKQNEQRTQLQEKIAADLANRLNNQSVEPVPDIQPAITRDHHQSSSGLLWLWLLLFLFVVAVIGWLLFGMPQRAIPHALFQPTELSTTDPMHKTSSSLKREVEKVRVG